jgi:hypothetical protein
MFRLLFFIALKSITTEGQSGNVTLAAQCSGVKAMENSMLPIRARLRYVTTRSLVGFLALAVLTFGQAATAMAQVTITQVFVDDPVADQVTIDGQNFDNGPTLEVTLGELGALDILAAAPNQIVAQLPVPLVAGDYLLGVRTGGGRGREDVYSLTIGAQVAGIPTNAIILWDQNTVCPAGFARVAAFDGSFLVGGDAPGTTGGANQHAHDAGTLTGPAHRHNLEPWNGSFAPVDDNSGGTNFNARTDVASGGAMVGTTGLADNLPPFRTILLCRSL